jgi:hypothetical protein
MFYKKEDVNEVMTCGICAQIYIDPRILPCGEFACNECIQSALNTVNEFKCKHCNEKHTPNGKDGFPVNQRLLKLLKAPAAAVSRHPRIEELKKKLDEVKEKCNSYKLDLGNGVDKINEHCIQLRNQVDLQTEVAIQKAHELNKNLRCEINKYEKNTIETFNQTKLEREHDTNKLIEDVEKFHTKTAKYLTEFKIGEKIVEDSLISAAKVIQDLKDKDIWSMVKTKMKFIKSEAQLGKTIIGCLVNEKTSFSRVEFKQLNLSIIRDYRSNFNLIALGNGEYEAFYINRDNLCSYITFDSLNVKNPPKPICNAKINKLNVVRVEDTFTVVFSLIQPDQSFYFGNQQFSSKNKRHCTIKVKSDFCNVKYFPNENSIRWAVASKSFLLVIESDEAKSPACILFSSRLEKLKTWPLVKILARDEMIVDVKINDASFFLLSSTNELKIFNIYTLAIVKVINVKADQIQLLSSSIMVLFDSANKNIFHYDQCADFERLETLNVPFQFNTTGLKLVCDDPKRYSLYV